MNWQGYKGPRTGWLDGLRRAKVNYGAQRFENCEYKISHSIEMGFNFTRPASTLMKRAAAIVHKVEDNIDALRAYEKGLKGEK